MTKPRQLSRIFRRKDLKPFYPKGKTQLFVDIKNGDFPAPVMLGKRDRGWFESDLIAWQQALVRRQKSLRRRKAPARRRKSRAA